MNPTTLQQFFSEADLRAMAALMSGTTMIGFERQIIAPVANPFALQWVPAGTPRTAPIGETRIVTGQDHTHIGDGMLHPGNSRADDLRPVWNHVTIDQIGEVFFDPATQEIPSANTSQTLGNSATILKGRIKISVGNAREQIIDFDLLAGVDFSVAAQHILAIEALVPDPASIVSSPPDIPIRSLATTVTTGVFCGLPPRGSRQCLTYSQVFFLTEERMAFMPVVPAAREVEVFVDQPAVAANFLSRVMASSRVLTSGWAYSIGA